MRAGVIGGGLCGLAAAIRLAQRGVPVELFEAAPNPGGRTRSFLEPHTGEWVDNGPHLLSGAYHATVALLDEAGAAAHIAWQPSLALPLWEQQRGHFLLHPTPSLPLPLALPLACARLPGHGLADIPPFLRLARLLKRTPPESERVRDWLHRARIPGPLLRDLLEPLCLGTMNETLDGANAGSFAAVLHEAFADHASARLGWFRKPLSEALVAPLRVMAERLGVRIRTASRIRGIRHDRQGIELHTTGGSHRFTAGIIALPLRATRRLLGLPCTVMTRRITNVHLWFPDMQPLTAPFIGGIGTTGQWFFDVSQQMDESRSLRHICAVISADDAALNGPALTDRVCSELAALTGNRQPLRARHVRIVSEHHATTSVLPAAALSPLAATLSDAIIDASEAPIPGELPATIESAVRRADKAAGQCYLQLNR